MKHLFYLLITFWFIPLAAQQSQTARHMENLGFVNIAEADSTIAIDLMYTRADNFTGRVLYEDLHEAYLHPDALKGLLRAQQELKKRLVLLFFLMPCFLPFLSCFCVTSHLIYLVKNHMI